MNENILDVYRQRISELESQVARLERLLTGKLRADGNDDAADQLDAMIDATKAARDGLSDAAQKLRAVAELPSCGLVEIKGEFIRVVAKDALDALLK